ncbi:sodium-independent sulfate anion transporter isoform X2 [Drosophila elegans]|uniref:sodium-independent sulfate anion transporter isoform X2 n=1 Tax=Drosophila elegans TaxID=30023 RepID=UPI0007E74AB9|nr:sodium-independent sulfate anion transporter isoform X2 [Drosophila elegans]
MYPQLETEAEALEKATARALLPGAISKPASEAGKAPTASKWKRRLHRHIPVFQWLPLYNTEWGIDDFIAGVTLGLTIIPESMACALLAGLPARYGLCSAFIGPLVYMVFGSIDKVIIGPTSLVALVSVQFTVGRPIEFAFLLTFLSGIVQIIMGTLRMGFIFEFISMPVIKAFSSATAILVIESQLKVLLGIKYLVAGLLNSIRMLSSRIEDSNMADLTVGVCAIIFLLLLEFLDRVANNENRNKILRICCRYLSTSRNTLIVLIAAIVSYIWIQKAGQVPFALSKNALATLPNFTVPSLAIVTPERSYSFWEVLKELNIGIVVIPIVGILTNISIGKLTPKGLVDTNQELLTVGLCNMFGSCVQAMPSSGAFTRYAISTACGLRTPMANLYLEATLAAILICSIFTLLDFKLPLRLWRDSKRDFATWLLCFLVSVLFGVEVGLFVSIVVTALHLLFLWARPEIRVKIEQLEEMQYIRVTPGNGIHFPAINYLRERVLKACTQADFKITVVIDGQRISGMDYTAAQGISKLSSDLCRQADASSSTLLILFRFPEHLQRLIDHTDNLVFCESEHKVKEFLTQESLRNGYINLKEHIRASIDLGYTVDID